ncbi:hypothetical protein B0H13DRAFT_2403531 [Mycena leptocephala]|nr:hypothetical protein B0H13DRAFT_2403531 [Mycena leptocephala]
MEGLYVAQDSKTGLNFYCWSSMCMCTVTDASVPHTYPVAHAVPCERHAQRTMMVFLVATSSSHCHRSTRTLRRIPSTFTSAVPIARVAAVASLYTVTDFLGLRTTIERVPPPLDASVSQVRRAPPTSCVAVAAAVLRPHAAVITSVHTAARSCEILLLPLAVLPAALPVPLAALAGSCSPLCGLYPSHTASVAFPLTAPSFPRALCCARGSRSITPAARYPPLGASSRPSMAPPICPAPAESIRLHSCCVPQHEHPNSRRLSARSRCPFPIIPHAIPPSSRPRALLQPSALSSTPLAHPDYRARCVGVSLRSKLTAVCFKTTYGRDSFNRSGTCRRGGFTTIPGEDSHGAVILEGHVPDPEEDLQASFVICQLPFIVDVKNAYTTICRRIKRLEQSYDTTPANLHVNLRGKNSFSHLQLTRSFYHRAQSILEVKAKLSACEHHVFASSPTIRVSRPIFCCLRIFLVVHTLHMHQPLVAPAHNASACTERFAFAIWSFPFATLPVLIIDRRGSTIIAGHLTFIWLAI